MLLGRLILKEHFTVFVALIVLNIASALASIAVIAFINEKLTIVSGEPTHILLQFFGLLSLLLCLRFVTQMSLTVVGHKFVYKFRNDFVKRIMDTDIKTIERVGSAKILASLSKDVEKIQLGFMRLPEFMQGSVLCIAAIVYLGYLSLDILGVVFAMITAIAFTAVVMVKKVYEYYKTVRDIEDNIYADYEAIINGRKELALNRLRAKYIFEQRLQKNAGNIKDNIIYGDTFHQSALNWANVMLLGSIGIVFYLANILGWADNSVATVFAVTLLFLQGPLVQTIGAIPAFLNAEVSFKQIADLHLAPQSSTSDINNDDFDIQSHTQKAWNSISMQQVGYAYQDKHGVETFAIGPIDFELKRGELVFLIGGNGSGKSTFAKILTGLYTPNSGDIFIDNQKVQETEHSHYRQLFSAIFTDMHLFKKTIGKDGYELTATEQETMHSWLDFLEMRDKLKFDDNNQVLNDNLSQGQRKRLAMLFSVLEGKDLILLDEWAADQDPQYRRTFYQEMLPKLTAMGKTVVVISHDNHYFEQADRLLQMKNGKLLELTGEERRMASIDAVATIS